MTANRFSHSEWSSLKWMLNRIFALQSLIAVNETQSVSVGRHLRLETHFIRLTIKDGAVSEDKLKIMADSSEYLTMKSAIGGAFA